MTDSLVFQQTETARATLKYAEYVRAVPGLTFGISRIDQDLLPLRRGMIWGLIGRPGHGKSTIAMFLAQREVDAIVATGRRELVAYATLDQPIEQMELMFQARHGIDAREVARGTADLRKLEGLLLQRPMQPLVYVGKSAIEARNQKPMTFRNIYAEIQQESARQDRRVSMVVLDYIQKFHVREHEERSKEVTEAIFAARELALDLQCKMVVCVQAARATETERDRLPRAHHCQHASAIEQEADALLSFWRPIKTEEPGAELPLAKKYKKSIKVVPNLFIMRLEKQRMAEAGKNYFLYMDPALVQLTDLEREEPREQQLEAAPVLPERRVELPENDSELEELPS